MIDFNWEEREVENTQGESFFIIFFLFLFSFSFLCAAGTHERLQWHRERASEPFKDVISARALPFLSFSHSPTTLFLWPGFFSIEKQKKNRSSLFFPLYWLDASHCKNVLPFFSVSFFSLLEYYTTDRRATEKTRGNPLNTYAREKKRDRTSSSALHNHI
jgi:hypothetical protein